MQISLARRLSWASTTSTVIYLVFFICKLRSCQDQSYYIGYTTDPDRRLIEHNEGKSRYTSRKIPWTLVYLVRFATKSEALKREKFLKAQRNSQFYETLIKAEK